MISVIIPVYNAEPYLNKCLDSIVNQNCKDLEVIIINDGSTDNSPAICEENTKKDSRIRLFHQDNKGLVYTRKLGIERARGEYITFIDADDYIDSEAFEVLSNIIDDSQPDMVVYGLKEVYFDHVTERVNRFEPGVYGKESLINDIIPSMLSQSSFFDFGILPNLVCKLIKKSFIDRSYLSISKNVTVGEDADMTFQLLAQADSLQIFDFCPYNYRKYDSSMMWMPLDITSIESLYNDLKTGFVYADIYDVMKTQLEDYITFIKLLKAPELVEEVKDFFRTSDMHIALYGAGGFGQALHGRYKDMISLWVDRDHKKYSYKGMPVKEVSSLIDHKEQYDRIFIAVTNSDVCRGIAESLKNKGITKECIHYYDRGLV